MALWLGFRDLELEETQTQILACLGFWLCSCWTCRTSFILQVSPL